jgi:hypothetical protein
MLMSQAESYLMKGAELYERIYAQSAAAVDNVPPPTRLTLSFDLFCLLVEYTSLVHRLNIGEGPAVEELLCSDALYFETRERQLSVGVDFFASPDTIVVS